jgi:hypothetical protein
MGIHELPEPEPQRRTARREVHLALSDEPLSQVIERP